MTSTVRPSSTRQPEVAQSERKLWRAMVLAAGAFYRKVDLFSRFFTRGKLGTDPVFRAMLRQGLIAPNSHVLDIGCGQGVLAALLRSADTFARQGRWPAGWAPPPTSVRVTGIELVETEARRARQALGQSIEVILGDMCDTPFPASDTVVILDVLHYVTIDRQDEVLRRVRGALPDGGFLLLRVGDTSQRARSGVTRLVDTMVVLFRGHSVVPQYTRTLDAWEAQLRSLGFQVRRQPMSQGTLFANVLLIAQVIAPEIASEKPST